MKKIILTIIALWLSSLAQASPASNALGEEKIEPVFYPKFSISGDYSYGKQFHWLDLGKFRNAMPNAWGASFAFEAGLYRYFNAGAILALRVPTRLTTNLEPLIARLLLFGKPFYPINNNFAIFSRIGGGILSSFFSNEQSYLNSLGTMKSETDFDHDAFDKQTKSTYSSEVTIDHLVLPFGASVLASIGAEFFPMSRVGVALEWGVRADFSWLIGRTNTKNKSLNDHSKKTTLNYMTLDFPLTATLHFIP